MRWERTRHFLATSRRIYSYVLDCQEIPYHRYGCYQTLQSQASFCFPSLHWQCIFATSNLLGRIYPLFYQSASETRSQVWSTSYHSAFWRTSQVRLQLLMLRTSTMLLARAHPSHPIVNCFRSSRRSRLDFNHSRLNFNHSRQGFNNSLQVWHLSRLDI